MPWVKLDDQFFTKAKARRAGKDGRALYLAGLCFCAANLTDGVITDDDLPFVAASADVKGTTANRLVTAGLWERTSGGYQVHDYLEYNPPADQVKEERRKDAERKRAERRNGGKKRPPGKGPVGQPPGRPRAVRQVVQADVPVESGRNPEVPSRPVVATNQSSSNIYPGEGAPFDDDDPASQTDESQAVGESVDLDSGGTNLSDADTPCDPTPADFDDGGALTTNGRVLGKGGRDANDAEAEPDVGQRRSSVEQTLDEVWTLIAEAELASRVTDKGPVGQPAEWLKRSRFWAAERHADRAAKIVDEYPDWPARRIAVTLEPERFGNDPVLARERQLAAAGKWGANMAGVLTEDELLDDAGRQFPDDNEAQIAAVEGWRSVSLRQGVQ